MTIIISKDGKNAKPIEPSELPNEDYLQQYVSENPQCLLLNTNFVSIKREFQTSAGAIDILAIDKNEDVYIIETKLFKNPTRRDVLAQILDYGIALSYDEEFTDKTIKYIILMDKINEDTKELINFVNEHCDFSVFAVQIQFHKTDTEEIVIPHRYGPEVKNPKIRQKWDEKLFFDKVRANLNEQQQHAIQSLYEFSISIGAKIKWGSGQSGSFNVVIPNVSKKSIYTVYGDGELVLNFEWLHNPKFEQRCKQLLVEKGLFAFPANFDEFTRSHYTVPIEEWLDHREQFQNIITELLER